MAEQAENNEQMDDPEQKGNKAKSKAKVDKGNEAGEDSGEDSGVTVSEEFQKKAHDLISGATKHEVKHVHDKAYSREDELRKQEMKDKPDEFSAAEMPSMD